MFQITILLGQHNSWIGQNLSSLVILKFAHWSICFFLASPSSPKNIFHSQNKIFCQTSALFFLEKISWLCPSLPCWMKKIIPLMQSFLFFGIILCTAKMFHFQVKLISNFDQGFDAILFRKLQNPFFLHACFGRTQLGGRRRGRTPTRGGGGFQGSPTYLPFPSNPTEQTEIYFSLGELLTFSSETKIISAWSLLNPRNIFPPCLNAIPRGRREGLPSGLKHWIYRLRPLRMRASSGRVGGFPWYDN